jgi:hypothetical protein
MGTRLELQSRLEALQEGVTVYFQPPPNVEMIYPAIVYNRDYQNDVHADNVRYAYWRRYQVMVIDRDPDSTIPDEVSALPMSKYVRHFTTEGLNHDIYYVYF